MASFADLTTAVNQLSTDINTLITAVQNIPAGTLSAADQAALDAAVTQIQTIDTTVTTETTTVEPPAPTA